MNKNGVIIINKENGLSSFAVVNRVKRIMGVEKAGHTGTLDPMATGVLPVLLGRAVKASEYMLTSDKHYIATLLLGITTDTEDVTGEVLTKSEDIPNSESVFSAISSMIGSSEQIPLLRLEERSFATLRGAAKQLNANRGLLQYIV